MPLYRAAYSAFVLFACLYALARGRWPERAGVGVCVAGSLLSVVAQRPSLAPYREVMNGVLTVDLAVAASFLLVGATSRRFWPIWSLAFTLAGIFVHLARETLAGAPAARYFFGAGLWACPAIVAMVVGTRLEAGAERTAGR